MEFWTKNHTHFKVCVCFVLFFCQGAAESDHDDKENEDSFDAAADPHKLLNVDLSKYVWHGLS